MPLLKTPLYGNTVLSWLLAALTMLLVLGGLFLFRQVIINRLAALSKSTANQLDDYLIETIKRTRLLFMIILSAYAGTMVLNLPPQVGHLASRIAVIALLVQSALWLNDLLASLLSSYSRSSQGVGSRATAAAALGYLGRIILFSVVVLLILDNLGVKISALIAGLGIGGIAVALALQTILGDLFGSLTIVLDKPFVIGDLITVDDLTGTVEHIGLKSTRIRSLSGEMLVISNHDLLNSRIRNYQQMQERRVVLQIGVVYQTPHQKVAAIPGLIQQVVQDQEGVRFERAHFKSFGASALEFEVVYYVLSPDYDYFMDRQQKVNLELLRCFEENQIDFAYPTQTLYVNPQ